VIELKPPKVPKALDGPESPGVRETEEAILHFADEENWTVEFPFSAYRHPEVRQSLTESFHGKCAYCESTYRQGFPVDVEHYRPKGGVTVLKEGKSVLEPPGYYWLAAAWENLLPSCADCNRPRKQTVEGVPEQLYGKGNQFPITNVQRATEKGRERYERRLLLHPCRDKPEEHLTFTEAGNVVSVGESRMGEESIRVYALRRHGLMQERMARAKEIMAAVRSYQVAKQVLAANPSSPELQQLLEFHVVALCSFLQPDRPYLAMARQLIAQELPDWDTRCS
jgi:uncharacterized protein (TIGR02646 family)